MSRVSRWEEEGTREAEKKGKERGTNSTGERFQRIHETDAFNRRKDVLSAFGHQTRSEGMLSHQYRMYCDHVKTKMNNQSRSRPLSLPSLSPSLHSRLTVNSLAGNPSLSSGLSNPTGTLSNPVIEIDGRPFPPFSFLLMRILISSSSSSNSDKTSSSRRETRASLRSGDSSSRKAGEKLGERWWSLLVLVLIPHESCCCC